jgi:mycofactocin precursor
VRIERSLPPREPTMPDRTTVIDPPAAEPADPRTETTDTQPDEVVAADLLIEEISIDGMCGVY